MKPKRCIISWATHGREPYPRGLKRLIPSAIASGHRGRENGYLIFSPDLDIDTIEGIGINKVIPATFPIPSHQRIPYGFKPWLFRLAFSSGFTQVLWCDSTIIIHKPLDQIWDIAAKRGMFVGDNPGCPMRVWTSDDAMYQMGCPFMPEGTPAIGAIQQDAMFNEIMACAMAFDLTHPKAKQIFMEWFALCNDGVTFAGRGGSTRPEFRAHRHDQSAISWLTHKYEVEREPYGMLCYFDAIKEKKEDGTLKFPEHILVNTGL